MKPFNNRARIEIISENKAKNSVFDPLESSQKYTLVKYIEHSTNNKDLESTLYDILSKFQRNQDIYMFVETHMIENVEMDDNKYYFIPISGIVCFTSKNKSNLREVSKL